MVRKCHSQNITFICQRYVFDLVTTFNLVLDLIIAVCCNKVIFTWILYYAKAWVKYSFDLANIWLKCTAHQHLLVYFSIEKPTWNTSVHTTSFSPHMCKHMHLNLGIQSKHQAHQPIKSCAVTQLRIRWQTLTNLSLHQTWYDRERDK